MDLLNGLKCLYTSMHENHLEDIATEMYDYTSCFSSMQTTHAHLLTPDVIDKVMILGDFIFEYVVYLRINHVSIYHRAKGDMFFLFNHITRPRMTTHGRFESHRYGREMYLRVRNCRRRFSDLQTHNNWQISRQLDPETFPARETIFSRTGSEQETFLKNLNDLLYNVNVVATPVWVLNSLGDLILKCNSLSRGETSFHLTKIFLEEVFLYCTLVDFTKILQAVKRSFVHRQFTLEYFTLKYQEMKDFIQRLTQKILQQSGLPVFMVDHLRVLQKRALDTLQEVATVCESGVDNSHVYLLENVKLLDQSRYDRHVLNAITLKHINTIDMHPNGDISYLFNDLKTCLTDINLQKSSSFVFEQILFVLEYVLSYKFYSYSSTHEFFDVNMEHLCSYKATIDCIHETVKKFQDYTTRYEERMERILICINGFISIGKVLENETSQIENICRTTFEGSFLNIYESDSVKQIIKDIWELHIAANNPSAIPMELLTDLGEIITRIPETELLETLGQPFGNHTLCTFVHSAFFIINTAFYYDNGGPLQGELLRGDQMMSFFMVANIKYMKLSEEERLLAPYPLRNCLELLELLCETLPFESGFIDLPALEERPEDSKPLNALWRKIEEAADLSAIENNTSDTECIICMAAEKITDVNYGILDNCVHLSCHPCYKEWFKSRNTCPMCRSRTSAWTSREHFLNYKKEKST